MSLVSSVFLSVLNRRSQKKAEIAEHDALFIYDRVAPLYESVYNCIIIFCNRTLRGGIKMSRILVVEDDIVISQVVCEFLKEYGYQVESVFDGKVALERFQEEQFDLIVLDIMIPSMTGLEVLKEIRKTSQIPILMLTAMGDEYTQLISFNQIISDYVVKPFSPTILVKRIENILRGKGDTDSIEIGTILIQPTSGAVYMEEEEVQLTKKEYEVLLYLAKRRGKIVSRDNLMMGIWGYTELDSRVLDNHIKNIRKKLPSLPLKTVVGRGYQIEDT